MWPFFLFLRHLGRLIPSSGVHVHAGLIFVFPRIIHRSLIWTTGSLTCVRGLSYAGLVCDTRGLGSHRHTDSESAQPFSDSEKLLFFPLVLLSVGIRTLDLLYLQSNALTPEPTQTPLYSLFNRLL